jgi:hypothetical protein
LSHYIIIIIIIIIVRSLTYIFSAIAHSGAACGLSLSITNDDDVTDDRIKKDSPKSSSAACFRRLFIFAGRFRWMEVCMYVCTLKEKSARERVYSSSTS